MAWVRSGTVTYSHAVREADVDSVMESSVSVRHDLASLYLVVTKSNSDERRIARLLADFRKTGSAPLHLREGRDGQNDRRGRPGSGTGSGGQARPPRRVRGPRGIAQLFDRPPCPDRRPDRHRRGRRVYGLAIDIEYALLEYLDMFYNLGFAGRAMKRIGAIDFVTTVAPVCATSSSPARSRNASSR